MHHHGLGNCDCAPAGMASPQKLRALWITCLLVASFSAIELGMSHTSHSLSLLADAGHMVADVFAIAMALLAAWIAQWPASEKAPFGYRRIEILAALVNGIGLLLIAGWIGKEAFEQFQGQLQGQPTEILTTPMAITAALGLGVNGLNAFLLHHHSAEDLNLRGAFLHMLADAISCLGVLVGAIAIATFHWIWVDGVMSVAIAGLILTIALPLIQESLRILLEQSPSHIDLGRVRQHLLADPAVASVTQLRVWTLAPGQICLTASLSVQVPTGIQRDLLLGKLQTSLRSQFQIHETTLQMVSSPSVALTTLPNTKIRELIQADLPETEAAATPP
jgi:cobalt-zinc-cadmium efflux system protein